MLQQQITLLPAPTKKQQQCIFAFSLQKGQLGRPIVDMPYWNAKPSPMPNIGAKYGRKATWIGASGDQTFLRIDEALINSHVLATSEIFASKHIIGTLILEFEGLLLEICSNKNIHACPGLN